MKTSKFIDEQIAFALRQAETIQRWERVVKKRQETTCEGGIDLEPYG